MPEQGLSMPDPEVILDRFKGVLEAAPDATIAVRSDGRIAVVNTLAEKLFGYGRDEMLDQPVEILVPEAARPAHRRHREGYVARPTTRPMGAGLELAGRHKDGREFPVEISLSSIETEEGLLVSAAIRDITDRKRLAQTLQEKNAELERANRAKDRFLASMSHELRTPLNAILGFTGTLLMGLPGPLNDEQRAQLQTVRNSARHLLTIINDLLDLAKIDSGKVELALEAVDCRAVVDDVATSLRPLAEAKGLGFEVACPRQTVTAWADRRALTQILLNLANNAVKFTEAGTIRIVVTGGAPTEEGAGHVTIDVVDTGIGIAPADQERLFEAFEQLGNRPPTQEGTGLGLHISRKLAELLGASIHCSSKPAQGSTFTVELKRD
jgi:protein-histidine pros-kinase